MSDWITTTHQLVQNKQYRDSFEGTEEYLTAFESWATNNMPELYGND